jgi:hypothetical protein
MKKMALDWNCQSGKRLNQLIGVGGQEGKGYRSKFLKFKK